MEIFPQRGDSVRKVLTLLINFILSSNVISLFFELRITLFNNLVSKAREKRALPFQYLKTKPKLR